MTTGVPGEPLVLAITDDRAHRLQRYASVIVDLTPRATLYRHVFGVFGILLLLLGLLMLRDNVVYGVALLLGTLWFLEHCALRSGSLRRVRKFLDRDPYLLDVTSYTIDESGLHSDSPTMQSHMTWPRFQEVRTYRGGLVLITTGSLSLVDLPPSSFTDQEVKAQAEASIRTWVVDASLDS